MEMINQCDGCQAGYPVVGGLHKMGSGQYPDYMVCKKSDYVNTKEAIHTVLDQLNHDLELLKDYSEFLMRNGYIDTDWMDEEPFAITEFMKERQKMVKAK